MSDNPSETGCLFEADIKDYEFDLPRTISKVNLATALSSPVSPGTISDATLNSFSVDQDHIPKANDIDPPARPKSTPFSFQNTATSNGGAEVTGGRDRLLGSSVESDMCDCAADSGSPRITFGDLPTEVLDLVLDHLFGFRASTVSQTANSRGWSSALRHSRRRQLSDVALVSGALRGLVQGRIFRHIKIQGTRPSIAEGVAFFLEHPQLQTLVKHIEVWSPVWERRPGIACSTTIPPTTAERIHPHGTTLTTSLLTAREPNSTVVSPYQMATQNCSLAEIFLFVEMLFPDACILTLEGGHCKKPPMVRYFTEREEADHSPNSLPILHTIRTLVLKSAWTLMRTEDDFDHIMAAMPNLQEWHCSYAKAKSKAYLNICTVVPKLPSTLRHLNVSLESSYTRESLSPRFWRKIYPSRAHICTQLAQAIPQLESFTYCGRICSSFFGEVMHLADPDRRGNSRLKAIDLTVKNCCRAPSVFVDGSGMNDPAFMKAFEELVALGIGSMRHFKALESLRIRFVDLESPMPFLNPFFQYKNGVCTGLWSDRILLALSAARPKASFVELAEDFGGIIYDKDGKLVFGDKTLKRRPMSLKMSSYDAFSTVIAIN